MVQARALLLAADGVATNEVARRCGPPAESVRAWRRRFVEQGALTVSGYRTGTGSAVVAGGGDGRGAGR